VILDIVPDVPDIVRRFVIAGAGQQAQLLAGRVLGNGQDVVLVDDDAMHVAEARSKGLTVIEADPKDIQTWQDLEPETIRAVAVLLPDDEANLEASWVLREDLFAEQRIVSVAHDSIQAGKFVELDVQAVNPSLSPVVELEYMLLYPSVSSLISDMDDEHDVAEVRLRNPALTDRPIHSLELPEGVLIILIRRENQVIYPRGHTRLEIDDRLTLMGPLQSVRQMTRWAQER
jgi:trk system potassium uptake protein TrkA